MTNKEIAEVLDEIGLLLELCGENPFKVRTYTNMARKIEAWEEEAAALAGAGRLREIPGLGDALEQKITELVTQGQLTYHQDLRAKFPASLFDLFAIGGLGAKRIKTLYESEGIDSFEKLEVACNEGRIAAIKGFGPKMQQKILDGIAFAKQHQGQFRLDTAHAEAYRLLERLRVQPGLQRIEVAGSLRRGKELVKDIDLVASSHAPEALMEAFVTAEGVARVTGRGETKSSVVLDSGIAADLRVVSDEQFPFALVHFTGSKDHNVAMRQRAKDRGFKLNEYGLFRDDDSSLACQDERAIFAALGLPFLPPELREDRGEFDVTATPPLVERDDLAGVIHNHTSYSDGHNTLEEMARAAKALGYTYIGIADHSQSAAYAGGLQPRRIAQQHAEIAALNKKLEGIRILKGIESDIRADGSLDYDEEVLASFDFVVASVHSKLEMSKEEATRRLVKAIENPYTTILGHPTTRLLLQRDGFDLDWEAIFAACVANRVAIEINANARRLDIDWRHIRRGKETGVTFCIGPDAHRTEGLRDVEYGLGIARKGWLEKRDLLNCLSANAFVKWKQKG